MRFRFNLMFLFDYSYFDFGSINFMKPYIVYVINKSFFIVCREI